MSNSTLSRMSSTKSHRNVFVVRIYAIDMTVEELQMQILQKSQHLSQERKITEHYNFCFVPHAY